MKNACRVRLKIVWQRLLYFEYHTHLWWNYYKVVIKFTYTCSDIDFQKFMIFLQGGNYTVVLKATERNKHFRVQVNEEGLYQIGQQKFANLDDLIEHYKKHPIFKHESEKLYLVKAFNLPAEF